MPAALRLSLSCAVVLAALAAGCTHMDPYRDVKTMEDRSPLPDPRSVLPRDFPIKEADKETSALPPRMVQELIATEELRLAMLDHLRQMGDERAWFERSVFGLTPLLLFQASRMENHVAARRQVVGIGAGLATWSAWLSRRPDDFESLYAEGAEQLACLMAGATEYLYTDDELPLTPAGRWSSQLQTRIDDYQDAADRLLDAMGREAVIPGKPATCAVAGSSLCKAKSAAVGSGDVDPTAGLGAMRQRIDANVAFADQRRAELAALEEDVDRKMPRQLAAKRNVIGQALERRLREKRPPLPTSDDVARQVLEAIDKARKAAPAQSSGRDRGNGDAPTRFEPFALPAALRNWGMKPIDDHKAKLLGNARTAESDLRKLLRSAPEARALRGQQATATKDFLAELRCRPSATLFATETPATGSGAPVPGSKPLDPKGTSGGGQTP